MMVGWRCGSEGAVGFGVERWRECEAAGQVGEVLARKTFIVVL